MVGVLIALIFLFFNWNLTELRSRISAIFIMLLLLFLVSYSSKKISDGVNRVWAPLSPNFRGAGEFWSGIFSGDWAIFIQISLIFFLWSLFLWNSPEVYTARLCYICYNNPGHGIKKPGKYSFSIKFNSY